MPPGIIVRPIFSSPNDFLTGAAASGAGPKPIARFRTFHAAAKGLGTGEGWAFGVGGMADGSLPRGGIPGRIALLHLRTCSV